MFNKNSVRRYKPIEYDEMPGEMVTAEEFDRMYDTITNHAPEPQPIPEERAGREATFQEWFTANHARLMDAYRKQTDEPPYKEIFIFAKAAWEEAQLAAQPSVQRDEDGIGWCSSCDKIHEVARPKCPSCGDWLIFAADDKPEDSAKSFNEGVAAVVAFLEVWNTRGDYIQSAAFFAGKIATLKRITAERGSK